MWARGSVRGHVVSKQPLAVYIKNTTKRKRQNATEKEHETRGGKANYHCFDQSAYASLSQQWAQDPNARDMFLQTVAHGLVC